MDEKVYRQRRNLMILCIVIILIYMGPGGFNAIGLLQNLWVYTLELNMMEPWKIKAMTLVMYLYYAWRYYQYCNEYPSPFVSSINQYINKYEIRKLERRLRMIAEFHVQNAHMNNKMINWEVISSDTISVKINGVLYGWSFTFPTSREILLQNSESSNGSYMRHTRCEDSVFVYEMSEFSWLPYKLKIIFKAGFHLPGFTDWIIPWLIFWGTYTMIIYHEVITPAAQLLAL